MPSRRRTSKSASSRKKNAAHKVVQNPPIVSTDEKRQLILAHASMRKNGDPVQMMSMWAGVAIVIAVIAVGWWWSSGSIFINTARRIGPEVKSTVQDIPAVYASGTKQIRGSDIVQEALQASNKLHVLEVQAQSRRDTLNHMVNIIDASSTSSTRSNLFQPTSTSTPVTSTQKLTR